MNDPTSLSTNQSSTDTDDDSLNKNSPPPIVTDFNLLEIPCFPQQRATSQTPPLSTEPSLCNEELNLNQPVKYEYEFTNYCRGVLYFIHLWDDYDVSACERVCHCPLTKDDITYSPETGNGFVTDKYGLEYTFKKEPYKSSYCHTEISAGTDTPPLTEHRSRRTQAPSADDILASL